MKNQDFINWVKHRPYIVWPDHEVDKFKCIVHDKIHLDTISHEGYSRVMCTHPFKTPNPKFWLTKSEAMAKAPEAFI
jgi:hypothetical protein